MPRLRSLIDIFSSPTYTEDLAEAKETKICVTCKKSAEPFSNAMFKFEFDNSGLCEHCQERFFFNDDESDEPDGS